MHKYKYFTKKYLIGEILVAVLLSFGTVGAKQLVFPVNIPVTFQAVAIVLATCVLCFPVSVALFWLVEKVRWYFSTGKDRQLTKRQLALRWFLYFAIAFGAPMVYLLAFNPANMFTDSYIQVAMAIGEMKMDAWQCLFDILLIKLILSVCNTLQAVVIAEALFWATVLASVFYYVAKHSQRWVVTGIALFLLSFAPTQGLQVTTILKDVPFATTMLWMLLILMRLLERKGKTPKELYFEAGICTALICLVRLNGIVVAILFLGTFVILSKNRKWLLWTTVGVLLLVVPYQFASSQVDYRPVPPGSKYIALIYDMQTVKSSGYSVPQETEEYLSSVQDQEYMADYYEYDPTMGNSANMDYQFAEDYTLPRFIKIYFKTFFEHPIVFIRNILVRMNLFWDFTENIVPARSIGVRYYVEVPTYGPHPALSYDWSNFPSYGPRYENILTKVFSKVTDLSLSWPLVAVFWRVAPYVVLLIVLAISVALSGEKRQLILFLPLAGLLVGLLLTCFCSEYRYFWPFMLYCVILYLYPFQKKKV